MSETQTSSLAWDEIQQRVDQLSAQLSAPDLEPAKRPELQRSFTRLSELLEKHKQIEALETQITQTKTEVERDPELAELAQQEIEELQALLTILSQELEDLLFPADELYNRNAFIEIRAGAGGQEAALFASDLLKMYTNYAMNKGWNVEVMDISTTDLGGIREGTILIKGREVFGHLKREAGVHRVQRVPKTETQGRVHTSTATVAVFPEAEEVEVSFSPDELRIDTYRSGGAGGQHVNKTDSAVRITHIPSGIVVACQDERSQHKNRAKALKMLQARLLAHQKEKEESEQIKKRREMVGTGERAEKVRTYNFPQNRITDHQVDLTLKKLDMVMQGDIDEIIQALRAKDREERRKTAASSIV